MEDIWIVRIGFGGMMIGAAACLVDGLSVAALLRGTRGTLIHELPPAFYDLLVALGAVVFGVPLCLFDLVAAWRRRNVSIVFRSAYTLLALFGIILNVSVLPFTGYVIEAVAAWKGWVLIP